MVLMKPSLKLPTIDLNTKLEGVLKMQEKQVKDSEKLKKYIEQFEEGQVMIDEREEIKEEKQIQLQQLKKVIDLYEDLVHIHIQDTMGEESPGQGYEICLESKATKKCKLCHNISS